MNHEIKFRAWDTTYKEMHTVTGIHYETDGDISIYLDEPYNQYKYGSWADGSLHSMFGERVVLIQFTGLHDKSGVEIYEGDIVRDNNHEAQGTVMWDQEGADYNLVDGAGKFIQAFGFAKSEYEVIGNRFENPDLLKESE